MLGEVHTGLHAHFTAADNHHIASPILLGVHDGISRHSDVGPVHAGNVGNDRLGAHSGDHRVIAGPATMSGVTRVFMHHFDVPLGQPGAIKIVLIVLQCPLEGDVVGVLDGAAQLVAGLKQSDLVSAVGRGTLLHACRRGRRR